MENILIATAGLILGIILGLLGSSRAINSAKTRAAVAEAQLEALKTTSTNARLDTESSARILAELAPLGRRLELLDDQVDRLTQGQSQHLSTLGEQLRQAQVADREILKAASGLESALRRAPVRGTWGEASLRTVLESSGMVKHIHFTEQVTTNTDGNRSRPDVIVKLPEGAALIIDAKVPLEAFLKATKLPANDANNSAEFQDHAKALRRHIADLHGRNYQQQVNRSADLVVLYLPAESLLSSALEADSELLHYAMKNGVALATPASLLALLRSCAAVWAGQEITEDAQELLKLGRTLMERLKTVAGHLDKLGGSLRNCVLDYNKAVGSYESRLLVQARKLQAFSHSALLPDTLTGEDVQVRTLTATELVTPTESAG